MSWYRTGTVAVTSAGTIVTGSGTSWLDNASAGEGFVGPDGKMYEIASVDSNTQLTLAEAYLGSTASGQSYKIPPTQSFIRDLASAVSALVEAYRGVADAIDAGKFTIDASGISAIDINGGTADDVVIGGSSAAAGTFTTLTTTGNVTLGDATSDTVTVNGYIGVGVSPNSTIAVNVGPTSLTGANQIGAQFYPTATSSATSSVRGVYARGDTAAASFTTGYSVAFYAADPTKGAGSTITNLYGVYITDQTQGTNNYGITSLVSSGTNKWNIYASGTAANYFAGNVLVGVTSATTNGGKIETSNGITFPATQSACSNANTLDDYEEGIFTPTLVGSTSGTVNMVGKYRKVGNAVTCWINLVAPITAGTLVGNVSINGLPFALGGAYGDGRDGIYVPIPWIRGSSDTTANVRFATIAYGATTMKMYSAATFGDTTYYPGVASNFPAANIVQNGSTSIYLGLQFAYVV